MGEFADMSIEEQMFPNFDLIHSLELNKREQRRLQKLRQNFTWTDKSGERHKLPDIDDTYLQNIINFLKRKIANVPAFEDEYCGDDLWVMHDNSDYIDQLESVVDFLKWEQNQRKRG